MSQINQQKKQRYKTQQKSTRHLGRYDRLFRKKFNPYCVVGLIISMYQRKKCQRLKFANAKLFKLSMYQIYDNVRSH